MPNSVTPFLSYPSSSDAFTTAMSSISDNRSIDDLRRDIDYGKNQLKSLHSNSREYFNVMEGIQRDSRIFQEKMNSSHNRGNGLHEAATSNQNPPTSWSYVNPPAQDSLGGYNTLPPMSHQQNPNSFDSFSSYGTHPNGLFGQQDNGCAVASGGSTNDFMQDFSDDLFVLQSPTTGKLPTPTNLQTGNNTSAPLAHRPAASNKRPQHRLSDPWEEERAFKRPSPSPAMLSGNADPSSPASIMETYDESDLMEILGVNAKEEFEAMVREQKEAEEALQLRKEQERKDKEWARQFQPSDELMYSSRPSSGHPELYTPQTQPSVSPQTSVGSSLPNGSRSSALYHTKQEAGHNTGNMLNLHEGKQRSATNPPFGGAEIIDLMDSDDEEVGNLSALMHPRYVSTQHASFKHKQTPSSMASKDADALNSDPQFGAQPEHQYAGPSSSVNQVHGTGGAGVYNFVGGYETSNGQEVKTEQGLLGTIGQGLVSGAQGIYNTANTYLRNASEQILANGQAYANGLTGSFDSPLLIDGMGSLDHMTANQRALYEDLQEDLRRDPVNTAQEISSLLANIRPDEDIPPQQRTGTPESMSRSSALYEHQKLGLAWMVAQEVGSNKGGILADDMGLGKTVQALALMVSRRSGNPLCKTNLIIAPVGLLKQWEREISVRLRPEIEHRLRTFIYHGQTIKTPYEVLKQYDVVLTSFGTLASEMKRKDRQEDKKNADPNWRPSEKDILPILGANSKWYR